MASCLAKIPNKFKCIDIELTTYCIELTSSYGLDMKRGDCICAALQGLLFDFRIWLNCDIQVKTLVIDSISDLTKNSGDLLYKYIGIQRVVDFVKLHTMSSKSSQTAISLINLSNDQKLHHDIRDERKVIKNDDSNQYDEIFEETLLESKLVEFYDAGCRLLIIISESARIFFQKTKSSSFYTIPEKLILCMEEILQFDESSMISKDNNEVYGHTSRGHVLLVERILRVLIQIYSYAPASLLKCLNMLKFQETTAIAILTKPNYTLESRKLSLELLLWLLSQETRLIPIKLLEIRKQLHLDGYLVNHQGRVSMSKAKSALSSPSANNTGNSGNMLISDNKQHLDQSMQYAELSMKLKKVWEQLHMIALSVNESILCGHWNIKSLKSTETSLSSDNVTKETFDYLFESFSFDVASNSKGIASWLIIPLLPYFLSKCSLPIAQRILMSINVAFKTDESQIEVLCSFQDRLWMDYLISLIKFKDLIALSELALSVKSYSVAHSDTSSGISTSAMSDEYELVISSGKHSSNNTTIISKLNEFKTSNDDIHLASTCTELALDTLSTVMERKMRFNGTNSNIIWYNLQNSLKTSFEQLCYQFDQLNKYFISLDPSFESNILNSFLKIDNKRYLKRCLALVIQRIAKSTETWTKGLLEAINIMFSLIYSKRLSGSQFIEDFIQSSQFKFHQQHEKKLKEERNIKYNDISSTSSSTVDLLNLDDCESNAPYNNSVMASNDSLINLQTEEECQILCFTLDILSSVRKLLISSYSQAISVQNTQQAIANRKREWKVLKLGLAIVLGINHIMTVLTFMITIALVDREF